VLVTELKAGGDRAHVRSERLAPHELRDEGLVLLAVYSRLLPRQRLLTLAYTTGDKGIHARRR